MVGQHNTNTKLRILCMDLANQRSPVHICRVPALLGCLHQRRSPARERNRNPTRHPEHEPAPLRPRQRLAVPRPVSTVPTPHPQVSWPRAFATQRSPLSNCAFASAPLDPIRAEPLERCCFTTTNFILFVLLYAKIIYFWPSSLLPLSLLLYHNRSVGPNIP